MAKLINLPVPIEGNTEANASAESDRKRRLFAWADAVLRQLGLSQAIARASSVAALRRIVLDVDSVDVILAIREALHPAGGQRAEHFRGLREGGLKQILKNRFTELKKDREAALRRRRATLPIWCCSCASRQTGKACSPSTTFAFASRRANRCRRRTPRRVCGPIITIR